MSHQYHRDLSGGLCGKYARVAELLPAGCSVLEIGCSTGYFAEALANRGHRVLGMEYDAKAADAARQRGLDVRQGDVEEPGLLEGLPGPFEAVLLMDVLEHLRDPASVLRRLRPLLSPGGLLVVTGPNVAYWAVRRDLLLGRWNYSEAGIMDRTHLHFYTAATWRQLLEGAGYRVERLVPAEGMLPLEGRLSRLPVLGRLVGPMRRLALYLMPRLFTVVFLLEARPR